MCLVLLLVISAFCQTACRPERKHQNSIDLNTNPIKVTSEEFDKWDVNRAERDALSDIKNKRLKIYLHGTFAPERVGLTPEEQELVKMKKIPTEAAGVGCVIWGEDDTKLRGMQKEYAIKYNQTIIKYIKQVNANK